MKPSSVLSITVLAGALLAPAGACADDFGWTFAGTDISGSGTLTAIASGTLGLDYITGGSGNVDYNGATLAVTFALCSTPGDVCTFVNNDGAGANVTIDNWLYPGNSPNTDLDGNGIGLTPTPDAGDVAPPNISVLNVWGSPSGDFWSYSTPGGG